MNATRLGIIAFVAACGLFFVTMYAMRDRANDDAVTQLPDFSWLDEFEASLDQRARHQTLTLETTSTTASGETTVRRSKRYEAGTTVREDTLNPDGTVAHTRITDRSVVECDWAAKTCRTKVRAPNYAPSAELVRPTDRTQTAMINQITTPTSQRTIAGQPVSCGTPYSWEPLDLEVCYSADRTILYERRVENGTTTTTVATELLRFIPYEAIGLPFPLEGGQ